MHNETTKLCDFSFSNCHNRRRARWEGLATRLTHSKGIAYCFAIMGCAFHKETTLDLCQKWLQFVVLFELWAVHVSGGTVKLIGLGAGWFNLDHLGLLKNFHVWISFGCFPTLQGFRNHKAFVLHVFGIDKEVINGHVRDKTSFSHHFWNAPTHLVHLNQPYANNDLLKIGGLNHIAQHPRCPEAKNPLLCELDWWQPKFWPMALLGHFLLHLIWLSAQEHVWLLQILPFQICQWATMCHDTTKLCGFSFSNCHNRCRARFLSQRPVYGILMFTKEKFSHGIVPRVHQVPKKLFLKTCSCARAVFFLTYFSPEHLNAFAGNMINQNQKAVQVAAFGIHLHQIQRWHSTLYVREYMKTGLAGITPWSITHGQSFANTWVCLSSPQDAELKGIKCSLRAVAAASFLLLYLCNHRITGNLGPHHGSLVGDVHGLIIYIYIANVVERLNLKLISYQIVSYQILSYLFSRTACTLQLTSIPYTQTRSDRCSRRSPPVIGVAIHLCITPHVSSQLFLLGICP